MGKPMLWAKIANRIGIFQWNNAPVIPLTSCANILASEHSTFFRFQELEHSQKRARKIMNLSLPRIVCNSK